VKELAQEILRCNFSKEDIEAHEFEIIEQLIYEFTVGNAQLVPIDD
jgi:hypothetical protein